MIFLCISIHMFCQRIEALLLFITLLYYQQVDDGMIIINLRRTKGWENTL